MTWSKEVTLWCDDDDCVVWDTFTGGSVGRAVRKARQQGWTSPNWGEHYCPKHTS